MPKKIKFESFKYRFLVEAAKHRFAPQGEGLHWHDFLNGLDFRYVAGDVAMSWQSPVPGSMVIKAGGAKTDLICAMRLSLVTLPSMLAGHGCESLNPSLTGRPMCVLVR